MDYEAMLQSIMDEGYTVIEAEDILDTKIATGEIKVIQYA